jgi:hypothetical protein
LEELDYFSDSEKKKCPGCGMILLNEWNSCPLCRTRVKLICSECRAEIEKYYRSCPKCSESLHILSKENLEIFTAIKEYLSRIYTNPKKIPICPVCRKKADIVDCDGGDGPGTEELDYGHECICED